MTDFDKALVGMECAMNECVQFQIPHPPEVPSTEVLNRLKAMRAAFKILKQEATKVLVATCADLQVTQRKLHQAVGLLKICLDQIDPGLMHTVKRFIDDVEEE